jgi:hypothetical protein
MKVVVGGCQHVVPDDEARDHQVRDGEWCWCAPAVRDLPIFAADREGYAKVIYHAGSADRTARARRLA